MAQPGWYPDPSGQPGLRYFDGARWADAPMTQPGAPQSSTTQPPRFNQATTPDTNAYSQYLALSQTKTKPPTGLILVLGVILLAVVLVVALVIRSLGTVEHIETIEEESPIATASPTTEVCPRANYDDTRQEHPTGDGRVYGGRLSFPQLGDPWRAPSYGDSRVPFGRDVAAQWVIVHKEASWGANILVGELYAGDGFYEPEKASEIVNKCIFGAFYKGPEGNALVTPELIKSEAYTVDGYEAWYTEYDLHFEIPRLPTTNEIAIVIIVRTSDMTSSVYYASVPGDAMHLMPDVRHTISELRVHP